MWIALQGYTKFLHAVIFHPVSVWVACGAAVHSLGRVSQLLASIVIGKSIQFIAATHVEPKKERGALIHRSCSCIHWIGPVGTKKVTQQVARLVDWYYGAGHLATANFVHCEYTVK